VRDDGDRAAGELVAHQGERRVQAAAVRVGHRATLLEAAAGVADLAQDLVAVQIVCAV